MRKVMMFIMVIFIANILLGSYWIRRIYDVTNFGYLNYDARQGRFHSFSISYTSFNQDGRDIVYRQLQLDSGADVYVGKTIRLDDGNFFGIGQRYLDGTEPGENLFYYYLLGFTDEGNILFSKEIKNIGIALGTIDLIQFKDKIKFIGSNANNNGIEGEEVKTAILTFKTDGTLLKAVELSDLYPMDSFGVKFWDSYSVKVDSDHYGIAYGGYLPARNYAHYSGIWFFKLNQDDKIVLSKFYGIQKNDENGLDSSFGPCVIKKEDDGKFLLVTGRHKYINGPQTNGFSDLIIKLDSSFNLQWSKEYIPQFDHVSLNPINILKDSEGYTIGIDWRYVYIGEEGLPNSPIIFKTDLNGNILWSRKYKTDTIDLGYLRDFIKIPFGIALMTHSDYFCVLDENGEIPGDESISENVTLNCLDTDLYQELIDDDVIKISGSDIYLEDTAMSFLIMNHNTEPTITEYRMLQALCSRDIISERGLFSGHYVIHDNLTFQVDSRINPHVHNFKIYGWDVNSGEYSLLMEFNAEMGRNEYEMIFKYEGNSRNIGNSEYKIVAFNEKAEVIDMTSAISPNE